ncbi:DUF7948 domain-containing protein [Filimonas effusa]|uniref:PKD domain-containing protein n=1 Tax=Filimonas effusa TaxID=2508721 RepID=A0A4Q1D583_9BACT|nr:PKD domain-containing protein [Filimonas effusa]RXK82827.1 PKD domain-containing protein [Filimonas effusa]
MKTFTRITGFVLLLLAVRTADAQYYEFIENKGQWNERVKFKGNIPNGSFYLQTAGYKIVQHNAADLVALSEYYTGHSHGSASNAGSSQGGSSGGHAQQSALRSGDDHAGEGGTAGGAPGSGGTTPPLVVRSHAYEVTFLGASTTPTIIKDKPTEGYYNYFLGSDSSKWASGCKVFQAVTYKNIYPNIDIRYYTDNEFLKYDIIVNPGGNVSDIIMQFDGADKLEVKKGELKIKTTTGDVTERAPYTYELGGAGRKTVDASYMVSGNILKFKVGNYDAASTLVIDPTVIFATFSGSTSDNWGFTATYDGLGNFYAGGIVFGDLFPVTNGAYQTQFGGGDRSDNSAPCDIAIMKFNPSGRSLIYATLLGGSGNEQPHSMIVDQKNNLVIAGRTSSSNFPQTDTTWGPGGGFDIFITKLNETGSALIGSRRIGGTASDGVNIIPKYTSAGSFPLRPNYGDDARSEVILDDEDNIYLAAQTQSGNFRTTANAFQTTMGGGQDGVLIKTSPNVKNILFSSFLGGSKDDAAFVLALHPTTKNIYVAGGTTSLNFPGTQNGAVLQSSYQGGDDDGFVSIVSNDGSQLIKSSYFGTGANDLIFGIQFNRVGDPFIMGTTTGSWPVQNAAFVEANGKHFISKLNADLTAYQYSTTFGPNRTTPSISPTAFLVDRCENVYVSGWGGGITMSSGYNQNSGTRGLTTTPDAAVPNDNSRDGSDFYFFVLKKDATSQLYGTMFGQTGGMGDHVDGGTARFDKQGIIYQSICANCAGGARFPTTTGVWSNTNKALGGRGCNLAALKIAFNLAGVGTSIRASVNGIVKKSGCIPLTVDFRDTIGIAKTYTWNFGDNSPEVTTTTPSTSHTYTAVGIYRVRLIATDPSSCNISDTAYIEIKAGDNRADLGFTYRKLTPPCDQLNYEFTNTSTAPSKPFLDTSFVWSMGDGTILTRQSLTTPFVHQYASAGTYNVALRLVDTSYCNYPDSVVQQIRIAINVKAQFETPASGCHPYTAVFNNTSLGGQSFLWNFGDGTTSTEEYPSHTYAQPGTYTVTLTATDPTTCNVTDVSAPFTVTVSPNPVAGFTFTPTQPVKNTPYTFTNTSSGAVSYIWSFGDAEGVATTKRDTVISHIYNESGEYTVSLIATNQYGCRDTAEQQVSAIIEPLVDVPTAFTPNGDGINDYVRLRGYGVARMVFRIYNRWGVLMYESISAKDPGWDGRYKGALQPQDVYGFIADVEFSDGRRYQKKGDITLLR